MHIILGLYFCQKQTKKGRGSREREKEKCLEVKITKGVSCYEIRMQFLDQNQTDQNAKSEIMKTTNRWQIVTCFLCCPALRRQLGATPVVGHPQGQHRCSWHCHQHGALRVHGYFLGVPVCVTADTVSPDSDTAALNKLHIWRSQQNAQYWFRPACCHWGSEPAREDLTVSPFCNYVFQIK